MANRHLSRSIVLQTLFEWDFKKNKENNNFSKPIVTKMLQRNIREFAPGLEDDKFIFTLTENILQKRQGVDEIIEKAAPDWPLEKISVIDRNILRIGLTELLFGDRKEVPPKVAINEAIELAKTFGGENSGKFINGVLGTVYKEMGEPGKDEISKRKIKGQVEVDVSRLPQEHKGGALVYARKEKELYFAMVHDVFGYWTISKGGIKEGEDVAQATKREIQKEIGLDVKIQEKIGENKYVASHPEKGKVLKRVTYFLAESDFRELNLEKSGGLDEARWFRLSEIPGLHMYDDIIPIISRAIEIVTQKS